MENTSDKALDAIRSAIESLRILEEKIEVIGVERRFDQLGNPYFRVEFRSTTDLVKLGRMSGGSEARSLHMIDKLMDDSSTKKK